MEDYTGGVCENQFDDSREWGNRPPTGSEGCRPEPLDDGRKDYYSLREPITESVDDIDKDYYCTEDGQPLTAFAAVGSYIKHRHGENTTAERHGWKNGRQHYVKQRYHDGMAMDRQLLAEYENPTTVLLSLRVSPTVEGRLTLLTEVGDALDVVLSQLRYRLQMAPDAPFSANEWEYFAVIAGTKKRATPHVHIFVYAEGDVSRERFYPVVEKFVEKCEYAPDDMRGNRPDDDTISLRGAGDQSIPRADEDRLYSEDYEYEGKNSQGAVYALTQLPHLEDVDEMARDELLHSSTVDASLRKPFRSSEVELKQDFIATPV
jgi:hypothetical protein